MKSKVSAAASIFLLGMMIGSLAAAQDFHLKGIEISPGATTKNCIAGVGGNYTTNGITFAGSAAGDAQGTWVVSLDTTGALDANCEPVRCPENKLSGGSHGRKLAVKNITRHSWRANHWRNAAISAGRTGRGQLPGSRTW
jgi:hypothetical protein